MAKNQIRLTPCKACGEMISFITTAKGAQMPINPDKKVTVITLFGETVTGFIPHWVICILAALVIVCLPVLCWAEWQINIRQNFDFSSNDEIDNAQPYYELRAGYGPLYAFIQDERAGRIRWGGQHGGPISTQGLGVGLQYRFTRDRVSFLPWCQIGVYEINADLADIPYTRGTGNNSHWEALYLKTNEIVGHSPGKGDFKTYRMDFVNDGPAYGASLGFDIDYRIWKGASIFMGIGYTWLKVRYHIWGYSTPELDIHARHWSTDETLDLSYLTGSIGLKWRF